MPTRIITIGVGGASCSGKTTLAKHLARILSSPLIIHQDDFCPPSELIHIHPVHNVQDWDDPDTSIEWPRLRGFLSALRAKGLDAATEYSSYDYLNSQSSIPISDAIEERWKKEFDQVRSDANVVFVLVDGFIMFYDAQVVDKVDVKVMLRVPKQELKSRRESRAVYALQHATDAAAGSIWTDPPNYFDNIVYPAYLKAHEALFVDQNVEDGKLAPNAVERGIQVFTPAEGSEGMERVVDAACDAILQALRIGGGVVIKEE